MLLGVSKTLQRYLLARIPNTVADWITIAALQQDDPLALPQNKLVLFLYAVEENPHLRNRPPVSTSAGFIQPPLALTLHYLITYISKDGSDAQDWLSQVLRALQSQQRLGPADLDASLAGEVDQLVVRLRSVTPEDVQKIWTALNLGMRLSLYYDVDAAMIAPFEQTPTPPVSRRDVAIGVG
ncbi:MAG: DUF4255 domain-containing protein [Gaiellaceae bacterium]